MELIIKIVLNGQPVIGLKLVKMYLN